jgi:dihydroorotate dehydrogenase (fumarate)
MPDLSTTYMGLHLKNPVIAGASGLTANLAFIKRLEEAGVGAIAIKSLFEEQMQLEHFKFDEDMEKNNYRNPEMIEVHPHVEFAGADQHLMWVKEAKKEVRIPVIASLNAVNEPTWVDYAKRLEDTGVDALECNFFSAGRESEKDAGEVEREQVELVGTVKAAVSIPVSVKLSLFYTNPVHVIRRMDKAGAAAFVLFNRMLEPDIDIEKEEHIVPFNLSHDTDYRMSLRYTALLEGTINADLCCSTGIAEGETVLKSILAGAQVVQIVSAFLRFGPGHTRNILADMEQWMIEKKYDSLQAFRGKLSKRRLNNPWAYTEGQYASLLMHPETIIANAPTM